MIIIDLLINYFSFFSSKHSIFIVLKYRIFYKIFEVMYVTGSAGFKFQVISSVFK